MYVCMYICVCVCVYLLYIYALSFSSPYLLVFSDDRVRGTREQMMLQVKLVRLSREVGKKPESFILFGFEIFSKLWWKTLLLSLVVMVYELWLYLELI